MTSEIPAYIYIVRWNIFLWPNQNALIEWRRSTLFFENPNMGVMLRQPSLWFQVSFFSSCYLCELGRETSLEFQKYICWTMLCLALSRPKLLCPKTEKGRRTCCLKKINSHSWPYGGLFSFPVIEWMKRS